MTHRQAGQLNIVISLLFAALILIAARYVDVENKFTITGVLIAIWFVPFSILTTWGGENSVARELRCLRRWLFGSVDTK